MRLACLSLALAAACLSAQADTITYADLCHRLTDLDALAKLPPEGEIATEATSYDRASKYDAAGDKYISWDANGDGQGKISEDASSVTMAEMTGPGFINRIWSAAPGDGHVRIYIDGSTTPAVDLPFVDFFSGKAAPFNRPNLCYRTKKDGNAGWNSFVPIPFQKSCKIVADKSWGNYFDFGWTKLPPGTIVPTFNANLSAEDAAALDNADKILGQLGENPAGKHKGEKTDARGITLAPGTSSTLLDLTGAEAITAIKMSLTKNLAGRTGTGWTIDPEGQRRMLRGVTIQITWDDDQEPAVWAPLGDFFGTIGGAAPFTTLPTGRTPDQWFYSYWYMPFARHAHIVATNDGDQAVSLAWKISHAPLTEPIANLARFHAKWHRNAFLPTRADRMPDWTILTTQGRGRFVGVNLHVWFPVGGWWGEGDEKFFVDGEKFPSWFGTGSEDYFGYAWGDPAYFARAFHSQPINEDNRGHVDDNRWHIVDNVPFQKSFEGCIEKYQNDSQSRYAATAFWYLASGGTDNYTAQPVADRTGYWIQPLQDAAIIKGRDMKIPGTPPKEMQANQQMYPTLPRMWSDDDQFWWQNADPGKHLDLQFEVKTAGTYRVLLRPTLAPNYGISQLSIDGKNTGARIDLYYREVTAGDAVRLDTLHLDAGTHTLGITVTGKNPASQSCQFGFDYLKLEPTAESAKPDGNKFD